MQNISSADVLTVLGRLAETDADNRREINNYDSKPSCSDSDEEIVSQSPVFDKFHNEVGSSGILSMTNFSPNVFEEIWNDIDDAIKKKFRGSRVTGAAMPKDRFFMLLIVIKHGGSWEFLAQMFNCNISTFERMILRFCSILSPALYDKCVRRTEQTEAYCSLNQKDLTFRYHPYARYATDVCFQQSNLSLIHI